MIACSHCGEVVSMSSHDKKPEACPKCHGKNFKFGMDCGGGLSPVGGLVNRKNPDTGPDGITVNDPKHPRTSGADILQDGSVFREILGETPKNEYGSDETAERFRIYLNSNGENWDKLKSIHPSTPNNKGVDFIISNNSEEMFIQVTRALPSESWKGLSQSKTFSETIPINDVLDEILSAIEKKAKKHFDRGKENTILLIDAVDTHLYAFKKIAIEFRKRYGNEAKKSGFKAIWVVGAFPDLIHRLDE